MYEEILENIAQTNGLAEVNPYLKLAAGLGGILLCLLSTSFVAPLAIALLLSIGILLLARVDAQIYGELFIAPFTFALTSVFVIILLAGGGAPLWIWSPLPWLSFSITRASLNEGIFVFCRVIGGMSALIFIALTTPMTDLFGVMHRCRIPEEVLDLAMMIYRTIFLIMDQLVQTYQAQRMRLGYSSFSESIRSLSTLCGSVFISGWIAGEDLVRAMDARCYSGQFAMLGKVRPIELRPLLTMASFLFVSSAIVMLTGSITVI
ncbi:MAG TPA: cobalt ECF transporter T component CbiQ [Methanomicrobiales archaeon]|jgi:cobalt/nickel transport system permease protein|nr:cobalt ECF transporter T component CbiQ [Methanomicrobiales archaeon]